VNINRTVFLDLIAFSEGTSNQGHHAGYDVIVGSTERRGIFAKSLERHPNVVVELSASLWSTAAGRYQIIHPTWLLLERRWDLPDFEKASQDKAALGLVSDARALGEVDAGHIEKAITLCAHIWASLPGAGYGQHENTMPDLLNFFHERFSQLE